MTTVGIGLIGTGGMGRAHATAYRNVPLVFGDEPARPRLEIVADVDADAVTTFASRFGFSRHTTDWREVVADAAVDVVDITTPNHLHAEMAIAAAEAGKHVYCEKPLALDARDARRIVDAVERAGVLSMVGFNYLKNPAQGLARQLIAEGVLGEITLFRGQFDQDFLVDPDQPFSWRFDRTLAGSGALGDLGAHTVSLARYLVGGVVEVAGVQATAIPERAVPTGGSGYAATADADAPRRRVENEDLTQAIVRFTGGAIGTIGASRIATGRKLSLGYEIHGTEGSLVFTQERMNEIRLYRRDDPEREQGFRTIYIGPEHPGYGAFFGLAGVGLGYNDQKIIEARDLIVAVATGQPAAPDVRFAYEVDRVIDAIETASKEHRWVRIDEVG